MNSSSHIGSRESLLSINRQLLQEKEQFQSQVAILNAQLREMESGQSEAFAAVVSEAMSRVEARLLGIIEDQGREIAELRRTMAPLQAKYQIELEIERKKIEQTQQERKDAVLAYFNLMDLVTAKFRELIQGMNPEETEFIHQQTEAIQRLPMMQRRPKASQIINEQWTKERLLQQWT